MDEMEVEGQVGEDDEGALKSWLRLTQAASTLLDRKRSVEAFWAQKTRGDGRLLLQCRPTSVETGVVQPSYSSPLSSPDDGGSSASESASAASPSLVAGSSLVRLGGTQVLAVVTLQVGFVVASSSSSPGSSSATASVSASAAPGANSGMGGDVAVTCSYRDLLGSSYSSSSSVDPALPSYLQRVVEESADLEQLYIRCPPPPQLAGEGHQQTSSPPQAFRLCVGVEVLVDEGNVRDAALLACTAALADTRLPATTTDPAGDSRVQLVLPGGTTTMSRLSCPRLPVPLTVGLWEGCGGHGDAGTSSNSCQLIVDPSKEEQAALSGSIAVVVDAAAPHEEACVLSAEMTGRADLAALALAVKLAHGRAKELLPVLRPS